MNVIHIALIITKLEHVLTFLSGLPEGPLQNRLQNAVVELREHSTSFIHQVSLTHLLPVYNDLPHPPSTYIGDKYAWRCADGSCNNLSDPDMGKAGMPYARSVQQVHPLPRNELPDAGLVFDTLLKREKVGSPFTSEKTVVADRNAVCKASCWLI